MSKNHFGEIILHKDNVDLIDTTYGLLKENEYLDTVFIFCCIGTS